MKNAFTFLVSVLLLAAPAQGQIWENLYPGTEGLAFFPDAGNGIKLLACNAANERHFLSIDPVGGQLLATQDAGLCESNATIGATASTFDGGSIQAINVETTDNEQDVQVSKFDVNNELEWTLTIGDTLDDFALDVLPTRDGGFVVVLKTLTNPWTSFYSVVHLIKLDAEGSTVWDEAYPTPYSFAWYHGGLTESVHDGSLIVYYSFPIGGIDAASHFIVADGNGNFRFGKSVGAEQSAYGDYDIQSAKGTAWGGIEIYYSHYSGGSWGYTTYHEQVYNQIGTVTFNPKYAETGVEMPDGGTVFCENGQDSLYLIRVNSAGDTLWQNHFQGIANGMAKDENGAFFIIGSKEGQTWLMKLDSLFSRPSVAGKVFWDKNQNCLFDSGEEGLGDRELSIQNANTDYAGKEHTNFFFEQDGNSWIQQPYPALALLFSNDGGQSWQEISLPASFTEYLRGATVDADGRLWFWTGSDAAFTTDLGQSWQEMSLPGGSFNYPRSLVAKGNSVIGARRDGLFYSSDLGQNWEATDLAYAANSYHIFEIQGDSRIYFNGDNGQSWLSGNGGDAWTQTGVGFGNDASFGSPLFWLKHENTFIAQGAYKLFITNDFGVTWTQVDSVPGIGQPVVWEEHLWFSSFAYNGGSWKTSANGLFDAQVLQSKEEAFEKWHEIATFPNPTSGDFTLEFTLPQAAELRIEALAPLGRRMAVISENAVFQKGKHALFVDASDWGSGIYLLQIRNGQGQFFSQVILLL